MAARGACRCARPDNLERRLERRRRAFARRRTRTGSPHRRQRPCQACLTQTPTKLREPSVASARGSALHSTLDAGNSAAPRRGRRGRERPASGSPASTSRASTAARSSAPSTDDPHRPPPPPPDCRSGARRTGQRVGQRNGQPDATPPAGEELGRCVESPQPRFAAIASLFPRHPRRRPVPQRKSLCVPLSDEFGAAVRSNRTMISQREGHRDHEAADHDSSSDHRPGSR
jgi:hypothetical protein